MAKSIGRANGTGSVIKLSGKRSKPWGARITTGFDTSTGKQLRQYIGTYATRDEATEALINYNKNPYDITGGKATFEAVYEQWSNKKYPTVSKSNIQGYTAAYNRCSFLYRKQFKDIGIDDLQYVIDTCGCNYPTLKKIKILFNQLYQYAEPRSLCDKDYSRFIDIEQYRDKNPNAYNRSKFDTADIEKLYSLPDSDVCKIALMLIYSGMRIGELLNLKKENCFIDDCYIEVIAAKTKNGIRKVPLANKTYNLWKHFYNLDNESEYLISIDKRDFHSEKGYRAFYDTYWIPTMQALNIEKQIHETRHTCASLLTAAEVSQPKINKILGHTGKTTAENVYTHLDISELIEAINLI